GAAAIAVPESRRACAVPALDVAGGIFHVEELPVAPDRSFGVVRVGIDGIDLSAIRGGDETQQDQPQHRHTPSGRYADYIEPARGLPFGRDRLCSMAWNASSSVGRTSKSRAFASERCPWAARHGR